MIQSALGFSIVPTTALGTNIASAGMAFWYLAVVILVLGLAIDHLFHHRSPHDVWENVILGVGMALVLYLFWALPSMSIQNSPIDWIVYFIGLGILAIVGIWLDEQVFGENKR